MIVVTKEEPTTLQVTLTVIILDSKKDITELKNLESTWNFTWKDTNMGKLTGKGNNVLIIIDTSASMHIGDIWDHEWEHFSTKVRDTLKVALGHDEAFVRAFTYFRSQFRGLEWIVKCALTNDAVYEDIKKLEMK